LHQVGTSSLLNGLRIDQQPRNSSSTIVQQSLNNCSKSV